MRKAVHRAAFGLCMLALAAALLGGCGKGHSHTPSVAQVVVVNVADTFTVALVGVDFSGTVERAWSCSAPQAKLVLGAAILGGSVHAVIEDGLGAVVYDNTHSGTVGALVAQTAPGGVPGTWHVTLAFSGAVWDGAITLTADSPPTDDAVTIGAGLTSSGSWTFHAGWPAGAAQVTIASGLSAGSLRVRMWDGAEAPVYDLTALPPTGAVSESTAPGAAGTWTIQIDLTGASTGGAISLTH